MRQQFSTLNATSKCLAYVDDASDCGSILASHWVALVVAEQAVANAFVLVWGRWHEQGHWITLWQVLGALVVASLRLELYRQPALFATSLANLAAAYAVRTGSPSTELSVSPYFVLFFQ